MKGDKRLLIAILVLNALTLISQLIRILLQG